MKQYNRALDFMVLAMSELKKGKPVLAARLMASAAAQPDSDAAIAILEASNSHAFKASKLTAKAATSKSRLTASDEFPFEDEVDADVEVEDVDFDADPLDEVEDDELETEEEETEEEPTVAMAKVLARMTRKAR